MLLGVIGFSIKYTYGLFIYLTPIVLLMSLGLLFYYDRNNITKKEDSLLHIHLYFKLIG